MKTRAIATIMAIALAITLLAACSGGDAAPEVTPTPDTTAEPAPEPSDSITTGTDSWESIEVAAGRTVYLEENTEMEILSLDDGNAILYLAKGKAWVDVESKLGANESLVIQTPHTATAVTGTLLYIEATATDTTVCVIEGHAEVKAQDKDGTALTDDEGNDVAMSVAAGTVAQIAVADNAVSDAWTGEYIMADIAPFAEDGGDGPGGLYGELRKQHSDLIWREEVVSWGRSRSGSGWWTNWGYENYVGSVDLDGLDMSVSYPEGFDIHDGRNRHRREGSYYFPEHISSLGLYVTEDGTMDYHLNLIYEDFTAAYFDVYRGTLADGDIAFVRVQEETGVGVDHVFHLEGLSNLFYVVDYSDGGSYNSSSRSLVISTADANTFMETGALPGYEGAPFLDALRETLTYAHKETVLVASDGGASPLAKPALGTVTAYGRPGETTDIGSIYTTTGGYSVGSIDTDLTYSLPRAANSYSWNENVKAIALPSQATPMDSIPLYVTEDGTYSAHYVASTENFKNFFRDVYRGSLNDGNVGYVLAEKHIGTEITLSIPAGFSYVYNYARVGDINSAYNWGGSDYFTISTAAANTFMDTGVLPGFEDLPQSFLDALREELHYAYKEYAPRHR